MRRYYVYMLFCRDGTYYIGVTNNVDRRFAEHELGIHETCYTFSRRPLVLVWATEYSNILDAIACEKKLKGWSHRKKRDLIAGVFGRSVTPSSSRGTSSPSKASSGPSTSSG